MNLLLILLNQTETKAISPVARGSRVIFWRLKFTTFFENFPSLSVKGILSSRELKSICSGSMNCLMLIHLTVWALHGCHPIALRFLASECITERKTYQVQFGLVVHQRKAPNNTGLNEWVYLAKKKKKKKFRGGRPESRAPLQNPGKTRVGCRGEFFEMMDVFYILISWFLVVLTRLYALLKTCLRLKKGNFTAWKL